MDILIAFPLACVAVVVLAALIGVPLGLAWDWASERRKKRNGGDDNAGEDRSATGRQAQRNGRHPTRSGDDCTVY